MRPNWFLGLHGTWERGELPPAPAHFRVFAPSDWHFTVAFLGPVTEAAALRGWHAIQGAALPTEAIDVTLGELAPLGRGASAETYSALSALLLEGRDEVERLITDVRDACSEAAGARRDTRPAKAHMTMLRPERRASLEARTEGLVWAHRLGPLGWRGSLHSISLYTWSDDRAQTLFNTVQSRRFAEPK
jgi:2'-5' RNA ligase